MQEVPEDPGAAAVTAKRTTLIALIAAAAVLAGCDAPGDAIKRRAEVVKTCRDSGGEWYNTPGWGESCNFDTRSKP